MCVLPAETKETIKQQTCIVDILLLLLTKVVDNKIADSFSFSSFVDFFTCWEFRYYDTHCVVKWKGNTTSFK